MLKIPVSHSKTAVTQLGLDESKIETLVCEFAGGSMTETMYMHTPFDPSFVGSPFDHPPHVTIMHPATVGDAAKQMCRVFGPDGKPVLEIPAGLLINADNSPFASLTIQYGNGAAVKVDIVGTKFKGFVTTQGGPQIQAHQGTVPNPYPGFGKN